VNARLDDSPVMKLVKRAASEPIVFDSATLAERAVLGVLLNDGRALDRVNGLAVADFSTEEHRRVFQAMRDCWEVGTVDLVAVGTRLTDNGAGELVPHVAGIAQDAPSAQNLARYVEIVLERAQRRRLAELLGDLQQRVEREDLPELRRELRSRLDALETGRAAGDLCEHAFWIKDAQATTDLPYVVKGIFGMGQIVVVWGRPGSGKTFVTMEMSCCIGAGRRWHGRRTRKGIVLYVAAESARAYIENRFAALKAERPELSDAEVLVVPLALDLLHAPKGDVERVVETVRALERERGEVVLIVIDTLAVTFGGGDENSPEDMGLYVSNVLYVREKTGAAVLIVHHSGKDEARGMRGHTALLGALDAELAIEGEPGQERILRTGKVRDGDGHTDLFAFGLRPVELGIDSDGDSVRTCVLEAKDEASTRRVRRERKGAGLGKNQRAVIRALEAGGGRMARTDLAHKLKDEGMPRNRVHDAIAGLLDSGMLVPHNDCLPPEVSLV
jgi:hypothetical protein